MKQNTPNATLIFSLYAIPTILLYLHPNTRKNIDLFLSLIHILFLNIIATTQTQNRYSIVSKSTILYYIITTFVYALKYLNHNKNTFLIFIIHHVVSIGILLYFSNTQIPEIQNFIMHLIFILNLTVISQNFYDLSRDLPNECKKHNTNIYFVVFFLIRIILFPLFVLASIKKIQPFLSRREAWVLSFIALVFFALLIHWVYELSKKIT